MKLPYVLKGGPIATTGGKMNAEIVRPHGKGLQRKAPRWSFLNW
jgi:hypothetical protein